MIEAWVRRAVFFGFIFCGCVSWVMAEESEVLLVAFTAPGDAACKQIAPLIETLVAQNLPVTRVDAAKSPDLVAHYRVTTFPTLIALANGQEVDRVVGSVDPIVAQSRVVRMFEQAKNHLRSNGMNNSIRENAADLLPKLPASKSTPPVSSGITTGIAATGTASVRLKVSDNHGYSWGTGTIIDSRLGSALVLTCGHLFRDSQGKGTIEVHLFDGNTSVSIPGRCLRYNLETDLAFVEIRTPTRVNVIPLAPADYAIQRGQAVTSIGCDGGDNPTVKNHQILSLDRVATPSTHQRPFYYIQVSGAPVSGRSGGGLFTDDGYLVGVCNTADPLVNDGHFVPPQVIRDELDAARLSIVHQTPSHGEPEPIILASHTASNTASDLKPLPIVSISDSLQRNEVIFREEGTLGAARGMTEPLVALTEHPTSPTLRERSLTPHEQATLQEIQRRQEAGDEVIVIVRPRGQTQAPSDVIVIQNPSSAFMSAISQGATSQKVVSR